MIHAIKPNVNITLRIILCIPKVNIMYYVRSQDLQQFHV